MPYFLPTREAPGLSHSLWEFKSQGSGGWGRSGCKFQLHLCMLRCFVKCRGQTALKTASMTITWCSFYSSSGFFLHQGTFSPSRLFSIVPTDLTRLHQVLQRPPPRSGGMGIKYTCVLLVQKPSLFSFPLEDNLIPAEAIPSQLL